MVLVSHDHGFIFLKTRKTGGTSVEMALQPLCTPPGHPVVEATSTILSLHGIVGARLVKESGGAVHEVGGWRNHRPAAWIRRTLGDDVWRRYRRITIVRNPFDRAVSGFNFTTAKTKEGFADFAAMKARFRRWLIEGKLRDDREVLFIGDSFVPTEVLRFETMAADVTRLMASFNVPFAAGDLPHAKAFGHLKPRPVADYYDEETRRLILTRFDWAFDRFDYRPDP